jgi:hypothetical protein
MMLIESRAAAAPASAAILALLHEMEAVPSNYDDDLRVRIMPTCDPDTKDFSRYSPKKSSRNQRVCFTTAFNM